MDTDATQKKLRKEHLKTRKKWVKAEKAKAQALQAQAEELKAIKLQIIQQQATGLMLAIAQAFPCMTQEAGIVVRRTLAKEMTAQEADNLQQVYSIVSRVALSGFGVSRTPSDIESHWNALSTFHQIGACLLVER